MKVMSVFGTRPEAIKMAPVVKSLAGDAAFETQVCVTAQHRHMLDQVLDFFGIRPDFDLDLMRPRQSLNELVGDVLRALRGLYEERRPDLVLVHGDTATAFAAGLAAYYAKIAVGHVEAGLRTADKYSPWPEEMNRRLLGVIADAHFAPTEKARANLAAEGVRPESIYVTGNTVIDALLETSGRLRDDAAAREALAARFPFLDAGKSLILVTAHRRENFGPGLESICRALADIARRDDVQIVYPVHLNPSVRETAERLLAGRVFLLEPQGYLPFVYLMSRCRLILTDSGGLQEEAPALGKPILVLRETTERPEILAAGGARLVGVEREAIARETNALLDDEAAYERMARVRYAYGDGHAAERIRDILKTGPFPGGPGR